MHLVLFSNEMELFSAPERRSFRGRKQHLAIIRLNLGFSLLMYTTLVVFCTSVYVQYALQDKTFSLKLNPDP